MFIVIVHYKAPLSAIDAAFARHQGWLQQGYHDGIILCCPVRRFPARVGSSSPMA